MTKPARLELLGGLSPQAFMRQHWQKKPLLIRQAVQNMQPLVSRQALFDLAQQHDVESRLVCGNGVTEAWQLQHGPFKRRQLPSLSRSCWTLLVQGVDLQVDVVAALRDRFRFLPDARLDDVMVSYATDGGGVGPHVDSYDVFLLQAKGQRRWRIGPQKQVRFKEGEPLKILAEFKPTHTWVLEPGDMLYLPPHYAHEGVAVGECMTYSMGFKAETMHGLAGALMARLADQEPFGHDHRYADPQALPAKRPANIPAHLQTFARQSLRQALENKDAIDVALGEWLTEPKQQVWFESQSMPKRAPLAVRLDRRTQMLYDTRHVYINGESWRCQGDDARWLKTLADQRFLARPQLAQASGALRQQLWVWLRAGWLHPLVVNRDNRANVANSPIIEG